MAKLIMFNGSDVSGVNHEKLIMLRHRKFQKLLLLNAVCREICALFVT